jgi:hypothetical protein
MKLAGHILAFYLLLLSGIPCCVFDNCSSDETAQTANQENEDKDCGNCSPFFSCEGCAAATIACEPVATGMSPVQQSAVFTGYIQNSLPSIEYGFWQPPKLG